LIRPERGLERMGKQCPTSGLGHAGKKSTKKKETVPHPRSGRKFLLITRPRRLEERKKSPLKSTNQEKNRRTPRVKTPDFAVSPGRYG